MKTLSPFILLLVMGQMVALSVNSVWAQPLEDQRGPALEVSISYGSIYQLETDLEEGGSFEASRQYIHAGITGPLGPRITAGLELTFGMEAWDFSDSSTVGGATPWETIHQHSISLPVLYAVNDNWVMGVIPTVQYSGESGAEQGDSLVYGGAVILNYIHSRNLQLGLGYSAFNQLEEAFFAPFLLINWQVNDHLRISNPSTANPVGPAGVEVVYGPTPDWEFAVGGVFRHHRFRLSENNAVSSGIGQNEALVTFLRVQRKLGSRLALNVIGGASFGGKLTVEDSGGSRISSEAYDPAPMLALQLSCKF